VPEEHTTPIFLRKDFSNQLIKDAPLEYIFGWYSCCHTRYLNIEFSRIENMTTACLFSHELTNISPLTVPSLVLWKCPRPRKCDVFCRFSHFDVAEIFERPYLGPETEYAAVNGFKNARAFFVKCQVFRDWYSTASQLHPWTPTRPVYRLKVRHQFYVEHHMTQITRRIEHTEIFHNHLLLIRGKFHPSRKSTSRMDKEYESEDQLAFHWFAILK
jgi:hypothetical protein